MYLAASGVGRIGIVDFDVVDFTNLQRQVIHGTKDVGRKKLDSAADSMLDINPYMTGRQVRHRHHQRERARHHQRLRHGGRRHRQLPHALPDQRRLRAAEKAQRLRSIFRFEGQATIFAYPGGPCYRCLYPEPPPPGLVPSCAEGGVLGILPGTIGLIQATEAVKLILGIGESLVGRLLLYDALAMRFRELKLRRNPECPVCGDNPSIHELIDYHQFCGVPNPAEVAPVAEQQAGYMSDTEIDAVALKARLDRGDKFQFIDVREPNEYQIASIPGAKLIPLGDVPKRVGELDPNTEVIVHCKMGGRSAKACEFLRQSGFKNVKNMLGGITAWSDKIDPSVPKY